LLVISAELAIFNEAVQTPTVLFPNLGLTEAMQLNNNYSNCWYNWYLAVG
jgi:hypothetical protein